MNFVEGSGSRFGKSDCDKIKSGNAQFLCAFLWLALSPCFPFRKGMVDINTQMKNSKLLQFLLDNAETLKKELSRKITSANLFFYVAIQFCQNTEFSEKFNSTDADSQEFVPCAL